MTILEKKQISDFMFFLKKLESKRTIRAEVNETAKSKTQ